MSKKCKPTEPTLFLLPTPKNPSSERCVLDGENPVLPEDIIRNILKRLPVKSLIRFQCVCKHWKNLIKIPSFIADHLHHSAIQNPSLLFQGRDLFGPSGWCFLDHKMQVVKDQSAPLIDSLSGVMILASVNGLICFQSNNASIFLWNSATREVRQVFDAVNISGCRDFCLGFGFCSVVKDHRIVLMHVSKFKRFIRSEECSLCTSRVHEVQVYSLCTGSWKEIEFGNLDGVSIMSSGVDVNGAIFWRGFMLSVAEEDENDGHWVISFDIERELFTLIPFPSSAPKSHHNILTMHENKLAMLCHSCIGDFEFSLIDLWVMEEGTGASRERWNWIKKYSTSPFPYFLEPGTVLGNEVVCGFFCIRATEHEENEREDKVVLFNTITNEYKMFAIPEYDDDFFSFFNYVESLVPVGNNHIEEC